MKVVAMVAMATHALAAWTLFAMSEALQIDWTDLYIEKVM